MTPEVRKELAAKEAALHLDKAKERVVVVMPFQSAWIDPTEEGMEAIQNWAASKQISVGYTIHEFKVAKAEKPAKAAKEEKEK